MKAVILAAGVGSRLRPLTSQKPKCMVRVAGRPILEYQINAYAAAGIKDIVLVVGYEAESVKKYCRHMKNARITIIENHDYEDTNNMYSLYLARHHVQGERFLLSNGDVVFDPDIPFEIVNHNREDIIVVDAGSYMEESMKVIVDESNNITDISKEISPEHAFGSSIDVYLFSPVSSQIFFEQMREIIVDEQNVKDWTEVALKRLLNAGSLAMAPFDIGKKPWVEIDNFDDLAFAEMVFSPFDRSLKNKKLIFIDLDGTVFIGDEVIPGAKEFLAKLDKKGISHYFLSNNSSRSKGEYVEKLGKMDIDTSENEIILSTDGLTEYLLENNVNDIYVLGTTSMEIGLREAGINTNAKKPEYVVVGYDTELTYEKLRRAVLFINDGADYLATHCDMVCPTPEGLIPDIGALITLIEAATGKEPFKVFGKPNSEMIEHITRRQGVSVDEMAIIGDRIYTDMSLARKIGCEFVCVLSGETKREDLEELDPVPDLIVNNLGEIC